MPLPENAACDSPIFSFVYPPVPKKVLLVGVRFHKKKEKINLFLGQKLLETTQPTELTQEDINQDLDKPFAITQEDQNPLLKSANNTEKTNDNNI